MCPCMCVLGVSVSHALKVSSKVTKKTLGIQVRSSQQRGVCISLVRFLAKLKKGAPVWLNGLYNEDKV
jgi:hypothetical protein